MRFEGSKILSAGALVQEHGSSRSGSAPEEERGEELLCDRPFLRRIFDVILITEILTPRFLAINFCVLFLGLIYCRDQVFVEWD